MIFYQPAAIKRILKWITYWYMYIIFSISMG